MECNAWAVHGKRGDTGGGFAAAKIIHRPTPLQVFSQKKFDF